MSSNLQKENIRLLDIIDLKFLQEFQDACAQTANIAIVIVDDVGSITKPSNFTDFCLKHAKNIEDRFKNCNECDINLGKLVAEKGETIICDCHVGLTNFAVPIMLNGRHIASILGGQVFVEEPSEEHSRKVANELGINEQECLNSLSKTRIVSKEQINTAAKLLSLAANSISKMAHKNYELIKQRQKDDLLNEIIDAIRNTYNIERIKQYLIKSTGEYFDVDRCFFVDYDNSSGQFLPVKFEALKSSEIKSLIGCDVEKEFPEFCNKLRNKKKNIIIRDVEKTITRKNLLSHTALSSLLNSNAKSDYALLIQSKDQIVGILVLHFIHQKRILKNEELSFLRTIQYQVGQAICQNMLIEENKIIAENEQILRQVMLSSTFNFEQVINLIVTETGKLFKADRCFFIGIEKNMNVPIQEYAEYLSSSNILSHINVSPSVERTGGFIEQNKSNKIIYVENINSANLSEASRQMLVDILSVKSYLIATVKYDDILYGSLVLHYVNDYKKFSPKELNLAEAMANQSANIINQTKLYEKLTKQIEGEALIRKITENIRGSLDINTILNQICDELAKAFNVQRATIIQYHQNNDYSSFEVRREYKENSQIIGITNNPSFNFKVGEIWAKALEGKGNIVAVDNIAESDMPEFFKENYAKIGQKSIIIAPIKKDDLKWGVIILSEYNYSRCWTVEEKNLLEIISNQIYISLQQSELYSIMQQQIEREKAILANLPFQIWLKDKGGKFLAANEPFTKNCGMSVNDLIGKTDFDIWPNELAQKYVDDDNDVMKKHETKFVEELIMVCGEQRWHETYKTPLFNEKGEVVGTTGFARDITERKEIDKMKNEFVSTVSHELRTPLTSLSGALELILSGKMGEYSEKVKSLLDMAHNNSTRLTNLINDILDIEKIEAGKMDFNIKTLELMPLIEQAIQLNLQYAQKFEIGINLKAALPGVFVQVDAGRLMQVITNLLSNAIKFSEPVSAVEISVNKINDKIRVSVTNYGSQISQEFRSRIFQKFAQADSSDSRQKGGTGLGLSICKLIIEKMNGSINFVSESNRTTFYFDLPEFKEQKRSIDEQTCLNM